MSLHSVFKFNRLNQIIQLYCYKNIAKHFFLKNIHGNITGINIETDIIFCRSRVLDVYQASTNSHKQKVVELEQFQWSLELTQ